MENSKTTKESIKKNIYANVQKYFENISFEELKPSKWKVPIGGGFYDHNEVNSVIECYLNGSLSIQKPVAKFEENFSSYIGCEYGIATNSGTSANILALNALIESGELVPGDKVAIPATTFISVVTPILQLGLVPVYVDIKEDLNMDMEELQRVLLFEDNIKCVMVVHTLGFPADVETLLKLSKTYSFKIIEDCCESHGAAINGKKIGSYGDISTWSFYVAHHMTTAEGGMVLTNSERYKTILSELREFGRLKSYEGERFGYTKDNLVDFDERYVFHRIGWNFRMADAPASFGIEQLRKLDKMNATRKSNAKFLIDNLKKHKDLILPDYSSDEHEITYYSFPITIKQGSRINRKSFVQHLESNGIETRAIMCGTLPDQPSLKNSVHIIAGDLKISRHVRDNAFFIGCHPMLKQEDLQHAVDIIDEYLK
tara:strand:+ start:11196 stop:12479 length:1284 start_codon:yes stop_codon:yes gene_type:complete